MRYSCSLILAFYSIVRDMATAVPGWVFLCDECKTYAYVANWIFFFILETRAPWMYTSSYRHFTTCVVR